MFVQFADVFLVRTKIRVACIASVIRPASACSPRDSTSVGAALSPQVELLSTASASDSPTQILSVQIEPVATAYQANLSATASASQRSLR